MPGDSDKLRLSKALSYANGYLELGMLDHALQELDSLEEALRQSKEYAAMKLAILMQAQRWRDALPLANRLAAVEGSDPSHLVNLAYVTRRANSLEGARAILENAAKRFPREAIIHYNLGCYACCAEETDTAKSYLIRAFALDPHFIDLSAQDQDLAPLLPWIKTLSES